MAEEGLIKGIGTSAQWLNTVIVFGLGVAFVVLLLKLLRQDRLRVWGVEMTLNSIWIVFFALTVAHGVVTILHLKSVSTLMFYDSGVERNDPVRKRAWQEITTNGPLVFRHVIKRAQLGPFSMPNPLRPLQDPLALPTYISAAALCAAHVRWKGESPLSRARWTLVGLLITTVNWWIASWWVFGTAELPGSREAAKYLGAFQ